jgi:thiol-disulfide isomerase/thioredoxin
MNRFILLLCKLGIGALIIVSASCDNKTNGNFTVAVNYKNATVGKRLVLDEILLGGDTRPVFLDSVAMTAANGNALLNGSGKEESIYRLMVENGPIVLLINDVKKITLTIDVAKSDDYYTVTGSEGSKQLQEFINQYSAKSFTINKAFAQMDSLKQMNSSDSLLIVATNNKNNSIELLNEYMESFIDKSTHPAVSLFALSVAARSFAKEKFEKRYGMVLKQFPEHKALAQFKTNYDMQQVQIAESKAQQQSNWKGKQLPEFALPSAEGALVKLSSFKGKYVLIDFWASWCGPCRMENPNVVNAYNQFKNKNFTIVGVSLDKQKEPWLKAIKDDKLDWTHISDLKYWQSSAVEVFKFGGIPYNVLVDPKGVVIAENLRGEELENTLKGVLK